MVIWGYLFVVAGAAGVLAAGVLARRERRLTRGFAATGQLVAIEVDQKTTKSGISTYRYPVIRFHTADGREVQARSPYADAGGKAVGESIDVVYSPQDPAEFRVAGSSLGLVGVAAFGTAGAVLLLIGLLFVTYA
ncbi:DUF3592 domain-containing protein [Kribbella sp. NBC_01245]|uniref:DUF3592 domain-containing protein n=1 Tax=Kribbella sp. NBC_01245 TaxID=2903578 RepID=UPI002E2927D9|nr:DUF3592 domain-containing protein [Kribbella sp. NBC_01245]